MLRLDFSEDLVSPEELPELLLSDDLFLPVVAELPERCEVPLETDWPEDELLLAPGLTDVLLSELLAEDSVRLLLCCVVVAVPLLVGADVEVELCLDVPAGLL